MLALAGPHAGCGQRPRGAACWTLLAVRQEAWEARDSDAFRGLRRASAAAQRAQPAREHPEHYHRAFARRCAARGVRILPYDDPDYPLAFSRIPDMPLVLYCTGDPRWLNEPAAVGHGGQPQAHRVRPAGGSGPGRGPGQSRGRHRQRPGRRAGQRGHTAPLSGRRLPHHRRCWASPSTAPIPASNRELRRQIEQKGCVISEYPPESERRGSGSAFCSATASSQHSSSALVVVEAQEKSGTMSTVTHAERYGKPVFAVPGSIFSPNSQGTNTLLREGRAKAVCTAEDLFGALGLRPAEAAGGRSALQPPPLSENERRVLACIGPQARGRWRNWASQSGLPTALLLGTLMKLELSGRVLCLPGKRYILR